MRAPGRNSRKLGGAKSGGWSRLFFSAGIGADGHIVPGRLRNVAKERVGIQASHSGLFPCEPLLPQLLLQKAQLRLALGAGARAFAPKATVPRHIGNVVFIGDPLADFLEDPAFLPACIQRSAAAGAAERLVGQLISAIGALHIFTGFHSLDQKRVPGGVCRRYTGGGKGLSCRRSRRAPRECRPRHPPAPTRRRAVLRG